MAVTVHLAGTMPAGDRNGIADLGPRLVDEPKQPITCVVTLLPDNVKRKFNADMDETVTVRILDIEVIDGPERGFVESAARGVREERTGKALLPGFGTVVPDVAEGGERVLEEYGQQGLEQLERLANDDDPEDE